jgi:hypothetical protein
VRGQGFIVYFGGLWLVGQLMRWHDIGVWSGCGA